MALDIDRYAHLESPIHQWDPRVKIATLLFFVIIIALLNTLPLAFIALATAITLVKLSNIPRDFIFSGIKWVALFLIPFLIIMPITYPGEADLHLLGIPFSWPGFRLAMLIIIKALAIVLTSYVMFTSARFVDSMMALQHLKCPTVFVQMLLFTYRYIFVLIEEMRRMDTAMKARGFVKKADSYTLKVLGNFVGTLLIRSFERTERIYKAMLSKGYQGEFHSLQTYSVASSDYMKAGACTVLAILLISLDWGGLFNIAEHGWI